MKSLRSSRQQPPGMLRPRLHWSMTANAWLMTIREILFGQWPKFDVNASSAPLVIDKGNDS